MNSEKPSKDSANNVELIPYDSSCFAFLKAELDNPEILFQTMATTIPYPVEQATFEAFILKEHFTPYILKQGVDIIA